MTMNAEQFGRADALFQAACALPAGDRVSFVNETCAGDRALRSQVVRLLRHDDQPMVDFDSAIGSTLRAVSDELLRQPHRPIPTRIGAYHIIRQIGEGGFGAVYLAQQENPRRTVALKVIRSFMTSAEALGRFEHEIHILGRLQHPGIAQIFEAGIADASFDSGPVTAAPVRLPYYTMEFIPGRSLVDFADPPAEDDPPLDTAARLELVARVCDALQHAHQNGFIHRDLKPDNILVIDSETGPMSSSGHRMHGAQPKLLDFGVARALNDDEEREPLGATLKTRMGQLIGTPAYMSPEQVRGDSHRVDTRADVYAVGVMLYQLLAGRLPYEVGRATMVEAARLIEETDPPSLRTVLRTRAERVDGDVEAIVAKAMAKDPDRRYQSAAALALDIRRFLSGEPIEAKRDSALYLFRKNARRYRGALTTVAAFAILLGGFSLWAAKQARVSRSLAAEALVARRDAVAERDRANSAADRLAAEMTLSNIGRGRALGETGNHVAAENLIWGEFLAHPGSIPAKWALMEHYARFANIASLPAMVGTIHDVALSPDGSIIVAVGARPIVELWNAYTNTLIAALEGHIGAVNEACFSPDGHALATAGDDGTVIIWDVRNRKKDRQFAAGRGRATTVRFDASGKLIITGGEDRIVRICDARTLACLAESAPHPDEVACLAVSGDNRFLASGSLDRKARLWDLGAIRARIVDVGVRGDATQAVQTFPEPRVLRGHTDGVRELAFSHDGATLAAITGSRDRTILLWSTDDGSTRLTIRPPNGMPTAIAFSPDDQTLHVGGWFSIEAWRLADGVRTRHMQTNRCTSLELTADGSRLVGVAREDIRIWSLDDHPGVLRIDDSPSRALAFHPDGKLFATGRGFGEILLRDVETGELVGVLSLPQSEIPPRLRNRSIRAMAFDKTGEHVAARLADSTVRVWNLGSGQIVAVHTNVEGEMAQCLAYDPAGGRLGLALSGSAFKIENLEGTGGETALPAGGKQSLAIAFSPDGRWVATTSRRKSVRLWQINGEAVGELQTAYEPWSIAFSPDGARIAAGTWGNTIEVWDLKSLTRERILEGHFATVWSVCFKPDEPNLLASAGGDGTLRLWEVSTGINLATFGPIPDHALDLTAFSPDGRRLAAVSSGGSVKILNLAHLEGCIARNADFRRERARMRPRF